MIGAGEALAQQRIQSQRALAAATQRMELYQTLHSVTVNGEIFDEVARARQGMCIIGRRIERMEQMGQLEPLTIRQFLEQEADSE